MDALVARARAQEPAGQGRAASCSVFSCPRMAPVIVDAVVCVLIPFT